MAKIINKFTAVRVLLVVFFMVSSGCDDADSQLYRGEKKRQQGGAVKMIPARGGKIDLIITGYFPSQAIYLNRSIDQKFTIGFKTDEVGNFSLIIPRQQLDDYVLTVYDMKSNKWLEYKFTLSRDIRIRCNGTKFHCEESVF